MQSVFASIAAGTGLGGTNQPGEAGADGYAPIVSEDVVVLPPNGTRVDGRQLRPARRRFAGAEELTRATRPR